MDGPDSFAGWHLLVHVGVGFLPMALLAIALVWSEVRITQPKAVPRRRYRRPPDGGAAEQ